MSEEQPIRLDLPAPRARLAELAAGDTVELFGDVYTARDATHARIAQELAASCRLPFGLEGQALFYAGPTPPAAGRPAGAVGPTTASRMDAWTPALIAAGVTVTIGKGRRSEAVRLACERHGAVYLASVGGAAALLATRVLEATPVAYEDLGTEALVRLRLEAFPAIVAIDARGRLLGDSPEGRGR